MKILYKRSFQMKEYQYQSKEFCRLETLNDLTVPNLLDVVPDMGSKHISDSQDLETDHQQHPELVEKETCRLGNDESSTNLSPLLEECCVGRLEGEHGINLCGSRGAHIPRDILDVEHEEGFGEGLELQGKYNEKESVAEEAAWNEITDTQLEMDIEMNPLNAYSQNSKDKLESLLGGMEKHNFSQNSRGKRIESLQSEAVSKEACSLTQQESRSESNLLRVLWKHIECLDIKGKEAEERLSRERLEHLVSKVEEQVEFEGMVEDICMRIKAEGEFMDIERREREWEFERREVQLEEQAKLMRSQAERLQEEIKIVHAEKYILQKKQEEIDNARRLQLSQHQVEQCQDIGDEDASAHKEEEKVLGVIRSRQEDWVCSSETMLAAYQDMLRDAEERAEQERQALECLQDAFRAENQRWVDREKQLENQILALEKELCQMNYMLKEKESFISREKERRRQYGLEVDKTLAFWRDEMVVYKQTCEQLKKLEDCLDKLGGKILEVQVLSVGETGATIQEKLSELVRDVESVNCERLDMSAGPSKYQLVFEKDCIEKWKAQRDILEDERDKLEERLHSFVKKAEDNERSIDAMWHERERELLEKVSNMEAKLEHQETIWKKKELAFCQDRKMRELEMDTCRKDWEEERDKLQAIIMDREQWMEEHSKEWGCVLDAKEEQLLLLNSLQKKIADVLLMNRQRLKEIRKYLISCRKGDTKVSRLKVPKGHKSTEDRSALCTDESDQEVSCLTELSIGREIQRTDVGNKYYLDLEKLAKDLEIEIGKLDREVRREQERLEEDIMEVQSGTEDLKQERTELEIKVSETLFLMEELKREINAKEGQIEGERKQMEQILRANVSETEKLRGRLSIKEDEIEINAQKFKEEMAFIEKELEKERKERNEAMDLHFSARRMLITEMKEKEARWEREVDTLMQEVQDLKRDIKSRDQEIARLSREMKEPILPDEYGRAWEDGNITSDNNSVLKARKKTSLFDELNKQRQKNQESEFTKLDEDELFIETRESSPSENILLLGIGDRVGLVKSQCQMSIDRRDLEWQSAIRKIASFDNQIAEAMLAIQSLKEELSAKEKELQNARLERESDSKMRDVVWLQEQEQLQEQQREIEIQRTCEWRQREQALVKEKEELLNLLEAERADTVDAMAILQGAVRELQWALKHYKGKEDNCIGSVIEREDMLDASKLAAKSNLVKVHALHLEEVDHFILDLKLKVEEAEKRARAAEVALAVNEIKNSSRIGLGGALVPVRMDRRKNALHGESCQDDLLSSCVARDWSSLLDSEVEGDCSFGRTSVKQERLGGRHGRTAAIEGSTALRSDQRWARYPSEHGQYCDTGAYGTGVDSRLSTGVGGWMTVKDAADTSYVSREFPKQDSLAIVASTPSLRNQRRWLVDASWLENVRKEHAFLRHQLELERQRVSVLAQVEAENRWMEAAVVQALDQKRESDAKVLSLEKKVVFLENVIAKKSTSEFSA